MKFIFNILLIFLWALILSSCERASLIVESGTGSGSYATNTKIKIKAYLPNPGYEFDKWTGDTQAIEDVTQKETIITIPDFGEDIKIKIKATYLIDPSAQEYNLIIEDGTGSGSYLTYSVVKITANQPETGFKFSRWKGDIQYLSNPYTSTQKVVIKKENITLEATYITADVNIVIPNQNQFIYKGVALRPGASGSWDARFTGSISPGSVIKKGNTYFLYYIGARGDRTTDGGPAYRAMGVATSTDGIHFTKYSGNPIINIFPHNNQEEGQFSAATELDDNGNIVLYYTIAVAPNSTSESVATDIYVATSSDGLHFTNHKKIISHNDSKVWGYGDELFPIGAFHKNGQWNLYYIAKGHGALWDLGLATGSTKDNLINTRPVLTGGEYIIGGGDPVILPNGDIILFLLRGFESRIIEARKLNGGDPKSLSAPVKTYQFGDQLNSTMYFNSDTKEFFHYYLAKDGSAIKVKVVK